MILTGGIFGTNYLLKSDKSKDNMEAEEYEYNDVYQEDTQEVVDLEPSSNISLEETNINIQEETLPVVEISQEEILFAETLKNLNSENASAQLIDIYADNYSPADRNKSYMWDSKLFYTLEDISPTSDKDGLINGYNIEKKKLINAESKNQMEYEIYRNPENNKVSKIVSIEYLEEYLEITDYYYTDLGKVNFIFARRDLNYIPSYAVPSTDGQRFYFHKDVMVKWRRVEEGKQKNFVVGNEENDRGGNTGSVTIYDELSDKQKESFDKMEKNLINAAYNTYNIVLNAQGLSTIEGYVYDKDMLPLVDTSIQLYNDGFDRDVYNCMTDSIGKYVIVIPAEERSYQIIIEKDGYTSTTLYDINSNDQLIDLYQEIIYLEEDSEGAKYDVLFTFSDAFNYASDGNGMARIGNANASLRKGLNNKFGKIYISFITDEDGESLISAEPGMYTIELITTGYATTYYNVHISPYKKDIPIMTSPSLQEDEIRIVLTWDEEPYDLDSHLFTPYDISNNDTTYHIWYGNQYDSNSNNLDVDVRDGYGPETMTINHPGNGLYKYYVVDFTNCNDENFKSKAMSMSNAVVNVYTKAGLIQTFNVPSNRKGVIWEVFEIRNKRIVPLQRYYDNVDNQTWWHNE